MTIAEHTMSQSTTNESSRQAVQDAYSMPGDDYDAERIEHPRGLLQTELDVALVTALVPRVKPNQRVVEVGAGTGRFTLPILEAGHEMLATDINDSLLSKLEDKVERSGYASRCTVEKNDLFALSQEDGEVDVVVCIHVIPRLRNLDDQRAALTELARIVKPGGRLVFNYNSRRSPMARFTAAHTTPPSFVEEVLGAAGLTVREQRARWLLTRRLQDKLPLWACRAVAEVDRRLAPFPPKYAWDVFVAAEKKL